MPAESIFIGSRLSGSRFVLFPKNRKYPEKYPSANPPTLLHQASNPPCWCYTATHKQMYEMPFHLRHLEQKSALLAAGRTSYHPSMHEMSLANAKYTPTLFPVPRDRNNGPSSRNHVARYMSAFLHVLRIIPSTLPWGEQPPSVPLAIAEIEFLIPGKHISSISKPNKEKHGLTISEKVTIFDLLCQDADTGNYGRCISPKELKGQNQLSCASVS